MIKSVHRFPLQLLFALLLGALGVAGFAPFYIFPLSIFSLAGLLWLWSQRVEPTAGAWLGFVYGLGYFGAGVSWVYVSLHDFGAMPMLLAVIATFLFCAFLALFPALVGFIQAKSHARKTVKFLILIPALWVWSEWVRGWIFTGFPWLAMGYSQAPYSPLSGFAPVLGVYGVSLMAAISAGLLGGMLLGPAESGVRNHRKLWLGVLLTIWVAGFALKQIAWTQAEGEPVSVSLLQGNIPQDMKWQESRVQSTLDTYRDLVLSSRSRLIILPETAIPLFYHNVPFGYLDELTAKARANNGAVLIGLPEYDQNSGQAYYNSVLGFSGAAPQIYRKFHLVPFGEYVPLRPVFGWIIDSLQIPLTDFARGSTFQKPMEVAGQRVAVNVCYEDVFGEEIIHQLPAATMLVNVSNDAWFGDSVAPVQHLQISQMRALETGRYMLRATNTGVTAIVNERGQVMQRLPAFVSGVLEGKAQGFVGATPYIKWGNSVILVLLGLMLAIGLYLGQRKFSGSSQPTV